MKTYWTSALWLGLKNSWNLDEDAVKVTFRDRTMTAKPRILNFRIHGTCLSRSISVLTDIQSVWFLEKGLFSLRYKLLSVLVLGSIWDATRDYITFKDTERQAEISNEKNKETCIVVFGSDFSVGQFSSCVTHQLLSWSHLSLPSTVMEHSSVPGPAVSSREVVGTFSVLLIRARFGQALL